MASKDGSINFFERLGHRVINLMEAPAVFIREKIVLPNRGEPYPWYHMKYRRVPDIDQCYTDDIACIYEAEEQFKRDFKVEANIIRILRRRRDDCHLQESPNVERCTEVTKDYDDAELNLFIKYGDMGIKQSAQQAFMKQKHRLIFERRKAEGYVPRPHKPNETEKAFM